MAVKRTDIINKKSVIEKWISDGYTKQFICGKLNCKYGTLSKYLKILGLDFKSKSENNTKINIEDLLIKGNYIINTNRFKYRLIQKNYKEHKCENCNETEWLNEKIPIELHHIDGDRTNNTLNNLQILCSNCHALTANFKSKNPNKKTSVYCTCGSVKSYSAKSCLKCYSISLIKKDKPKKEKIKRENKCICGTLIKRSKQCRKCCNYNQRTVERPDKKILMQEVKEFGYCAIGRKYNVSDNAIRKWLK